MIDNLLKDKLDILEIPIGIAQNVPRNEAITACFKDLAGDYAQQWASPGEALEVLKPARQLYHNLGVDPTRYRPASEALLRRAIKGQEMPQINAAVDAGNYISLKFLLPLGLYDAKKIKGKIILRAGESGEVYEGLGKPEVRLQGKYVLADQNGPFGNPSSDSRRTSVDPDSQQLLMVIYMPLDDKRKEIIIEESQRIYDFLRN